MTQTRQLFGTDGIRGVAGEFPLTRDSVYWIGRALGHDLVHVNAQARVVIGQDTRVSSRWIADRFLQGLASVGVETRSAGVITTPGVAFLARSQGFDAGVVISASHNPWTDNGIKIFSGDGYKLPDARELAIEKEIFALLQAEAVPAPDSTPEIASVPGEEKLRQAYVRLARGWHFRRLEPAASSGRLRQWRGDCGSSGVVRGAQDQHDVSDFRAGWTEHQRELRRTASGNGGGVCRRKAGDASM